MRPPETDPAARIRSRLDQWKSPSAQAHLERHRLSEDSRDEPAFVEATLDEWLAQELNLIEPKAREVPWFDLLVTRWRGLARAAYEGEGLRCSYDDLHRTTAARAATWRAAGVASGMAVCVCRPFGYELLLDLLTGFRLGVRVAWVPAVGEPYERAALRSCQADYVTFDAAVLRRLGDPTPSVLLRCEPRAEQLWGRVEDVAASYGRRDPCLTVLSPTAATAEGDAPSWRWSSVTCEALLRAAARDAVLVWRLRPGDVLVAPGFDGSRHQPSLLLACLLAGGCYVHRTREQVERDPACLERSWRVIGVRGALADPWLAGLVAGATAAVCFRDLEEVWEPAVWNRFQERLAANTEVTAVLVEPSVGGVVLTTWPREESSDDAVRVLPGVGYQVVRPEGAPPTSGLSMLQLDAVDAPPYVLLWSLGNERYRYLGTDRPRRAGCVFPRDVLVDAVCSLPGVLAASVVALPTGGAGNGACFGLVVFVHSPSRWCDERDAAVRRAIEGFLKEVFAPEARPDFVECYPLGPPRGADGAVAAGWVMEQWSRGSLKRKARLSMFRRLVALGAEVA